MIKHGPSQGTMTDFYDAMHDAHWRPVEDLYGRLVEWRHTKTGRVVSHDEALGLWRRDGVCPVPF